MSLDPKNSTTNYKPRPIAPEGKHIARNYGVIDLGTQMVSFQGNPPEPKSIVLLMFEFPKLLHVFDEAKGPQPLVISQEYTNIASNKSKICKVLKAWRKLKDLPKQLDLKKYHGKWCEIKIEHKPNRTDPEIIYANIYDGGRGIDALSDEQKAIIPKLQTVPGLNKNIWLDFDNFDWNVYNELPEFIQKKIQQAKEWTAISAGQVGKTANADTTVDENDPDF